MHPKAPSHPSFHAVRTKTLEPRGWCRCQHRDPSTGFSYVFRGKNHGQNHHQHQHDHPLCSWRFIAVFKNSKKISVQFGDFHGFPSQPYLRVPEGIIVFSFTWPFRLHLHSQTHSHAIKTAQNHVTKGSVSYLSSPCFSTIIGGIGGPARAKRRLLDVMY